MESRDRTVDAAPNTTDAWRGGAPPVAEFWYAIEACDDGIVHLREAWIDPYLSGDMWLVRGAARDLLIDTGTGMVSPRPVLEAIAGKPLLAVALNSFYDHAGGLHAFVERGCHRLAAPRIAAPTPETSLTTVYVSDRMLRALPSAGYRTAGYRMQGTVPTRTFDDGDVIDLGDRQLMVLHVPGISLDGMGLWEAATGSLFTGDTLFDDPVSTRGLLPRDRGAFATSLARLRSLPVQTVYGGHFGRFGPARMHAIIDDVLGRQSG
jgi:glyoxylase-like metal-dependent hydrolase (beta-lactamase superfamily II)